ncbi:hypothetical protein [Mesonia aestuariivivens]|uniref:Uncharacterized protein n=1 Tax=Mesonia aestuariivivens TaxID=2796128 RepID=A0ABS6VZU2_9FLAO|nr:hypothetical protein [Mesonia aestuariivivens]MBW2960418.1 hypothetical protein [Mesonia aestuariivivens]
MLQNYEKKTNYRQNKRRLATLQGAKFDLEKELPLMFKAFREAYELYEMEISNTPPQARARAFEASLLNSKMIQSIQKYFPNHWRFGKYKRFTLRTNGYIVLFKKLDNYNRPMNVKTKSVLAISQQLSLPLYSEANFVEEPILFFGYKKDKVGNIAEPKLVYLDEERVKWIVTPNDITVDTSVKTSTQSRKVAAPIIRNGNKKIG